MIRLFTAITFPPRVNEQLIAMCSGIEQAKWTKPLQLHLTLKFFGEASEGQASLLTQELASIDLPKFELRLKGIGHFPGNDRRPKILWAGVEASSALLELQQTTIQAAETAGLETKEEAFNPHVTLARLNRFRLKDWSNWQEMHKGFQTEPVSVDQFSLMTSELTSSGPKYRNTASFEFA